MKIIIPFVLISILFSGCSLSNDEESNQSKSEGLSQSKNEEPNQSKSDGLSQSKSEEPSQNYNKTHKGKISGSSYDEFKIPLSKGSKLSIDIDADKLDVIIFSPVEITLENKTPFNVEIEGEYTIRVLMPRARARRKEEYEYQLSISVNKS